MVENEKTRTWAARLAAPLAFFAAATVLILLVQSGLSAGDGNSGTTSATPPPAADTTGATTTTRGKRKFYRVRRGDTLESIAAKFDTSVEVLIDLNPNIDPLALRPGQRIRIT